MKLCEITFIYWPPSSVRHLQSKHPYRSIMTHKYIFKTTEDTWGPNLASFLFGRGGGLEAKQNTAVTPACDPRRQESSGTPLRFPPHIEGPLPLSSFTPNPTARPATSRLTSNFLPGWSRRVGRLPAVHFIPASPTVLDALALNFHPPPKHTQHPPRAEPQLQKWERPLGNSAPLSQHALPFTSPVPPAPCHCMRIALGRLMQLSIFNMWAGYWSKRQVQKQDKM